MTSSKHTPDNQNYIMRMRNYHRICPKEIADNKKKELLKMST